MKWKWKMEKNGINNMENNGKKGNNKRTRMTIWERKKKRKKCSSQGKGRGVREESLVFFQKKNTLFSSHKGQWKGSCCLQLGLDQALE